MSLKKEEKHLPILISICFIGNFIFGGVGQAFPMGSFGQLFSWQWSSLLFMAGTSLYAAKLHTEKWHISSAGFILLSIGQGILFMIPDPGLTRESQMMFASAVMVFLPGMIFICYYSGFPAWLRLLGLLAMTPFLVTMIKIDMESYNAHEDQMLEASGFVLIQIVCLCWCYFLFRPNKKITVQE